MNFKHAILFLLCLFATPHASAQDFTVNKTNDDKVEITYNTKTKLERVELFVSTNSGRDYQGPLKISGDCYDIPKGKNKKIYWDPSVNTPQGYDGYFRFRLDRYQEDRYRKGFFLTLNPGFVGGDKSTCAGFGGTFGYMFRRFGLSLSLGSYFGGVDGYSYPYTYNYSWGPSTSSRYQDGFDPNFYLQFGALYRIVPKFSLKVGIGMLKDNSTEYGSLFNPLGSLGFMLQFNHFLLSTECVFTSESGYGFCGGLNFGVGYAF